MDSSEVDTTLADENKAFFTKADDALRDLFNRASKANELQFVFSLMPEFRGGQDPGWNTAVESQRAFDEYLAFLNDGELTPLKARIALAFYCHMSEASGFYEIPKNMLRVVGGEFYSLWPFQDLVEVHRRTGNIIAPNANKVLRDLAGHSETLQLHGLAEVFRDAFDPDLRNGYAHADYVIWDDGIRLRRRNGGNPKLVKWPEFHYRFERGINFFNTLRVLVDEHVRSYDPERQVGGHWEDGRPSSAIASFDSTAGSFSIKDSSP